MREVRDERGKSSPDILLVPNRVDRRAASGRDLTDALKDIGETVVLPAGYRTAFVDAFNAGQCVGQYAKNSQAHEEMRALAERVLKMLRKQGPDGCLPAVPNPSRPALDDVLAKHGG